MERPASLFDREREWADLVDFAQQAGAGMRLALVRGRRRQGKSFLLRRFAEATQGFYYQALQQERAQAIDSLASALGAYVGAPGGRLGFREWTDVVDAVADLPARGGPAVVVLDEFPYLLEHSPDLASVLQRGLDASRDYGPPVRLVLCGSALSVMANLLEGAQALRGRASHDLPIATFDYRTAARFWGIGDPAVAFHVHAVVGGTPGYRDLLTPSPPKRMADFDRWLEAGVLNPASALFREDEYLLTEERGLTDRALYHSVAAVVAAGETSQARIAAALGRESRAIQHPLKSLEEVGFLVREDDMLRERRPVYRLADPIVRFHHVVTRRDLARFEDRRFAAAWSDAKPRFATHVLGPHFEQLARDFTFRFAAPGTVGGVPARVGSAVLNDTRGRSRHQLDVVATHRTSVGSTEVLAIGEAKHSAHMRTMSDVHRLERIRELLVQRDPAAAAAKLLIFSASGFERALRSLAARRDDVELIDVDRMYHGD
jgi:AAA+ ATPase superfamily predicted ATPase